MSKAWSIEGKTCLVTGANSGIGYAAALELARRGAHTVLLCRNEQKGRDAVSGIAKHTLDQPELPGSLEAALRAFEEDAVLREALGKDFSDYYATSRAWELKAWRETVTEWERERYDRGV